MDKTPNNAAIFVSCRSRPAWRAANAPRILAAAPDAPVVVKHFADCFERTNLHSTLQALGVTELVLCGMTTPPPTGDKLR